MGINMSYLIIKNKDIYNKILHYTDSLNLNNPHAFVNKAISIAYNDCSYYVDELNDYIDSNESYLKEELETLFKNNIRIIEREGSFLLFVEFKDNMQKFFLDKCHILFAN